MSVRFVAESAIFGTLTIIVPASQLAQHIRKVLFLRFIELANVRDTPFGWADHSLEWPCCPIRYHCSEMLPFHDYPGRVTCQLRLGIVEQEVGTVFLLVSLERLMDRERFRRDVGERPGLAVRVRIGTAHHRSFVLEGLDVPYPFELLGHLRVEILPEGSAGQPASFLGSPLLFSIPCFNNPVDLLISHLRYREIVPWREADHIAFASGLLGLVQACDCAVLFDRTLRS